MKALLCFSALCALLAIAGCGGGSGDGSTGSTAAGESRPEESTGAGESTGKKESSTTGKKGKKESSGKKESASADESTGSAESAAKTGSSGTSPTEASSPGEGPRLSNKTEPKVSVPEGAPPKKLVVREIEKGDGAVAKNGDEVGIQYVGVIYKTGKQFDSSWQRNELFTFTLGDESTVPGFEEGIEGMRVGGRRKLIIPPKLGYGSSGVPPKVPPGATLVFVVDLLEVR
jgi:FKBP-type peptidyl-prolyl cis-trans isomerase